MITCHYKQMKIYNHWFATGVFSMIITFVRKWLMFFIVLIVDYTKIKQLYG
jgi:hypothetical protein